MELWLDEADISCGVVEVSNVSQITPTNVAQELHALFQCISEEYSDGIILTSFLIFSDVVTAKGGQLLANELKKLKLGKLWQTDVRKNPQTGNQIRMWMYQLNQKRVKRWLQKHNNN